MLLVGPLSGSFPVVQPFCLNPHGSPGLNHITCAKAWRQNTASEAAGVIRAGLCEHVYVWWREGRLGGVRAGLLEGTKGIIRGFGLRIREFKGIALIMGNWQKSLVVWASENMGRGRVWAYRYKEIETW